MESTKKIGDRGESRAEDYLKSLGYKILSRNYRTRFGELDIICQDEETLVFVEVKLKATDYFGSPGEMITKRKKGHLLASAKFYLLEKNYQGPWRFDAVLLAGKGLEHLENIEMD